MSKRLGGIKRLQIQNLSSHLLWTPDYTAPAGVGSYTYRRKAGLEFFVLFVFSPPSFCGACLNFSSRKGFSRPFPSSTVKSNCVYPRHNNRSPLVEHDVRENPSWFHCAEIRFHVPTSEGFDVTVPTKPPAYFPPVWGSSAFRFFFKLRTASNGPTAVPHVALAVELQYFSGPGVT